MLVQDLYLEQEKAPPPPPPPPPQWSTTGKIDICVCTFKRPRMLATLLRSLGNQSNTELFNSSIIIVDNDS